MKKILALSLIGLLTASASATEWEVLGARAQGMGGAGVALPNGAESAYWNPAGLGEADNKSGVQIPVGAHVAVSGTVVEGAKDLNNVISACQSSGGVANGSCSQANITNALNELNNPSNGVRADAGAGLGLKLGRAAFFVNDFAFIGGKPNADVSVADSGTGTVAVNNKSSLILRGINATEFGVGYGHELPYLPGLFGGVTLKGIVAHVGFNNYQINQNGSFGGGDASPMKNSQEGFQPSADAGVLWDVNKTDFFQNVWWRPRVGLTMHDINSPSFKYSQAAETQAQADGVPISNRYVLQSGTRLGLAISPLHFWNIALDADLTKNETALEGVDSQVVALGTEINVFNRSWLNIPLRAGLSKNMADPGAKTALAAGAGFNFLHVNIDVGASVTPGTETIQSQGKSESIPNEIAVSGQLAVLFGGNPDVTPSATR